MQTKPSVRSWLWVSDGQIKYSLDEVVPATTVKVPGHRQAHGAVTTDPRDDMILAAALEAKAEYVIGEDKHLFDLGTYQGMNRPQFETELDRLRVPISMSE